MTRARRGTVLDLWNRTVRDERGKTSTVPSKRNGVGKRWRARYFDDEGHEHTQAFHRKAEAEAWLGALDRVAR